MMVRMDDPMWEKLGEFPREARKAWEKGHSFASRLPEWDLDRIVLAGMGGSVIAGDFLAALAEKPFIVVREFGIPFELDERTLFIASSYSGETQEMLSCFEQALRTRAKKLAIGSGGTLEGRAKKEGVPFFKINYTAPPRAAFPWSFFPLLAILSKLGLSSVAKAEIEETFEALDKFKEATDRARRLAEELRERIPLIWGAGFLEGVARRWKTQLNENSKTCAFSESLPELCHNSVVGLRQRGLGGRIFVVMLYSSLLHPRVRSLYGCVAELLGDYGIPHEVIEAEARGKLPQMLWLSYLGDWVSLFLAEMQGVPPTPTEEIVKLKACLSRKEEECGRR